MILDNISNAALYYSISPRLKQAFEAISTLDLGGLAEGRHAIDGDDIFVNIMRVDGKQMKDAPLEVHNQYLDIQILLGGEAEGFGWRDRCSLAQPRGEFDTQRDICFYDDAPQCVYYMKRGQFTILLPQDAHAPMIGEGEIHKAIVKVRL